MHSALLLTHEQGRGEEYALVKLKLQPGVAEEFPVVPLRMQVSSTEFFVPLFNEPVSRRSYLSPPAENPLNELGIWGRLDTTGGGAILLEKYDIGYEDGQGVDWGAVRSVENGVVNSVYFTPFQMGPDSEVWMQLGDSTNWPGTGLGIVDLYLNIQGAGTGDPEYYRLRIDGNGASPTSWVISHVAGNGTVTDLATEPNWTVWAGDWISFRRAGANLTAYYGYYWYPDHEAEAPDPTASSDFGMWDEVVRTTDTAITEAGHVGFGANHAGGPFNFFAGDALTEIVDEEEVYLNIVPGGQEGIPGQPTNFTFEDIDEWTYLQNAGAIVDSAPNRHWAISTNYATDGLTSLKLRYETEYPIDEWLLHWRDFVNGGEPTVTYWLAYTFMVESWAQIYRNGVSPNGGFWLPGFQALQGFINNELYVTAPFIQPLSATSGQVGYAGTFSTINEGEHHAIVMGMSDDGTNRHIELWLNGTKIKEVDDLFGDPTTSRPHGIAMGNDNRTGGAVWIDQMTWDMDDMPVTPSVTDTATGTSTNQWVRLREKASGAGAAVGIDIDPDGLDAVPEAWVYADIYIPQSLIDEGMTTNDFANVIECDAASLFLHTLSGSPKTCRLELSVSGNASATILDADFKGDRWITIEIHYDAGDPTKVDVWLDNEFVQIPITGLGAATGMNYWSAFNPYFFSSTRDGYPWIGVDNLAYSTRGRVDDQQYDYWWNFEGAGALELANLNYPNPPFSATFGPGGYVTTLEEGMQGDGPGLPVGTVKITLTPASAEVVNLTTAGTVYVDLVPVSGATNFDAAEVYLTMSVLGGECYTTFSADQFGEGEAQLRWIADANLRWQGTDDLRWIGIPSLGDRIHC